MTAYDVIVAGAGAHGSAALWQLAARGQRVLGLDRFGPGHRMGSSHGISRVFRFAYNEGSFYVPLMQRAAELWQTLERQAGETLMHVTGTLEMAPVGHGSVESCLRSCHAHDLAHEMLERPAIQARYPVFELPPGYHGIWQPDGGFLLCERAIAAMQARALGTGTEIHHAEPLIDWEPTVDGGVRVRTERATYTAGRLILTVGGWMADHAPTLAPYLTTVRQSISWYEPIDAAPLRLGRFPVFMIASDIGEFYGFPIHDDRGFKIGGPHYGREPIDVHSTDREPSARQIELAQTFLPRFIPKAAGPMREIRGCVFTVTPDEHFVIDHLPGTPQVIAVSACSGHGFKFAAAIGEIVADLATGDACRFDLTPFRIGRFS